MRCVPVEGVMRSVMACRHRGYFFFFFLKEAILIVTIS